MLGALMFWSLIQEPTQHPAQPHMRLSLTGVGRFAQWVDRDSSREGPGYVDIRTLQVSEEDMVIGDKAYVGGWSWWRFDCAAHTADRLDFASITSDLIEGPRTPDHQPAYAASPGGDAAELLAVACGYEDPAVVSVTLNEAIALARTAMAD